MRVTHNFNRRLFPTKNFVPDSITFDTDHATFEYQSDAFTLDQTTTAINALDLCNEISNRARKKRAEKRGASLG